METDDGVIDEETVAPGIETGLPGLIFADPLKWATVLNTLEGSFVEVVLGTGESALGHLAGLDDNPDDEESVDLILRSEWDDGPAGSRIQIPLETICLIQIL